MRTTTLAPPTVPALPAALPTLHPQIHRDAQGQPTAVTLPYAEFEALQASAQAHAAALEKRRVQRAAQRAARKERQKQMVLRDLREGFAYIRAVERGEIKPTSLEDFLKELEAEGDDQD